MLPSTDTHEFLLVNDDTGDSSLDFAVVVSGSEMEPLLSEGDILLVEKQDYAEHGDLGIFIIDGVRRVKKTYLEDGSLRLSSLDINCADVIINEAHDITCEGKVVKVLHPGECKFSKI